GCGLVGIGGAEKVRSALAALAVEQLAAALPQANRVALAALDAALAGIVDLGQPTAACRFAGITRGLVVAARGFHRAHHALAGLVHGAERDAGFGESAVAVLFVRAERASQKRHAERLVLLHTGRTLLQR